MLPVSLSQRAHCVLNTQEMSSPRYSTISHSFFSAVLYERRQASAYVELSSSFHFIFGVVVLRITMFTACAAAICCCCRCENSESERDGKISDNYIFSLGKSERTKSETWTSLISFDFIYSSSAPCALSFLLSVFPSTVHICLWMNHWQVGSAYIDVWDE